MRPFISITDIEPYEYQPGHKVAISGIYRARHEPEHRPTHKVTCVVGKDFPRCRVCGDKARFELLQTAMYIETEDDFKAA